MITNGWQTAAVLAVISGTVFDADHHAVPSAKVYLQGSGSGSVQTDAKGMYVFSVSSGEYSLRLEGETAGDSFQVAEGARITRDLTSHPAFFDVPTFTVAGVTDNTYRGGHGSDTVLRSAEDLTKAAASLTELADKPPLEAVREYQKEAELHPTEPNLYRLAMELLSHGAVKEALAVLAKGVSVRMLLGSATAWYALGDYEKAKEWYFRATDLRPEDPAPYVFLAKVQAAAITQSKGYEERMARFSAIQPPNAFAIYSYAVVRQDRRLFEKALAVDPHFARAYLALGVMESQPKNAIVHYKKALAEDPKLQEAHFRLAEAYRVTGNFAGAKEEMAIFDKLAKQSALELERERAKTKRFVMAQ